MSSGTMTSTPPMNAITWMVHSLSVKRACVRSISPPPMNTNTL